MVGTVIEAAPDRCRVTCCDWLGMFEFCVKSINISSASRCPTVHSLTLLILKTNTISVLFFLLSPLWLLRGRREEEGGVLSQRALTELLPCLPSRRSDGRLWWCQVAPHHSQPARLPCRTSYHHQPPLTSHHHSRFACKLLPDNVVMTCELWSAVDIIESAIFLSKTRLDIHLITQSVVTEFYISCLAGLGCLAVVLSFRSVPSSAWGVSRW